MAKNAFPMRIVAFIIDAVVIWVVSTVIGTITWGPALAFLDGFGTFLGLFITALLFFLYFWILEGSQGQTIGKMLLSLKVVREDGGPVTLDTAMRRSFEFLLWPLVVPPVLDLIWVSDTGQRWGDRMAHTYVIPAK